MGYFWKMPAGALVLWLLVPGTWAGAPRPEGIMKALDDLSQAQIQIANNQAEIDQTRKTLETRMLSVMESQSLRDRIEMYREHISAYRAEAVADISYLRDHWSDLTPSEKEHVNRAQIDLEL